MDNGGGLTTSWGKRSEDEPSGEGGLLLTSRRMDRVSRGDTARDEGWTPSVGPVWTL